MTEDRNGVKDARTPSDRVLDLLGQMTLPEKLAQVERAYLEPNGMISIILRRGENGGGQPVRPQAP